MGFGFGCGGLCVDCNCQDAEFALNNIFLMESDSYTTYLFIPEDVLIQKYLADRLSMRQIASEFSCSKTYVRSLLLKYNIPARHRITAGQGGMPTASVRSVAKPLITRVSKELFQLSGRCMLKE